MSNRYHAIRSSNDDFGHHNDRHIQVVITLISPIVARPTSRSLYDWQQRANAAMSRFDRDGPAVSADLKKRSERRELRRGKLFAG